MIVGEGEDMRIRMNLTQIRRICDYLNKADWHFGRGHAREFRSCVDGAFNILMGVKVPEEGFVANLYTMVKQMHLQEAEAPPVRTVRDLAFRVLARTEQELYTPMEST
jgi:hypothetical protein